MQILQWLFQRAHEKKRESTISPATRNETISGEIAQGKDIILNQHHRAHRKRSKRGDGSKLSCKNLKIFACLYRKDIAKACFYSTLTLKRVNIFSRRQHFVYSMKMKKEEMARGVGITNKADSATHVGNKVLPLTEASLSTSRDRNGQCGTSENEAPVKGDKRKPISRMKELIRWATAAKTEKVGKFNGRKVLLFRRRSTLKTVPDDDQVSSDSPKISFRWDVESCSTTSSVYSAISTVSSLNNRQTQIPPSSISIPTEETDHMTTCRKGNWITTDSECKPSPLPVIFLFCGTGTMKGPRRFSMDGDQLLV
ncbi:hypothetical protein L6164_003287 [Bauhinia variegata]|uniref:Uncharacterized protein n=1 Tax=Bauhinia variegata TaxID=167791 RepID=A0ACB9Q6C1_BAUVA|nr:hypothetical protein L6164_003287 [Bauhinia variegata]